MLAGFCATATGPRRRPAFMGAPQGALFDRFSAHHAIADATRLIIRCVIFCRYPGPIAAMNRRGGRNRISSPYDAFRHCRVSGFCASLGRPQTDGVRCGTQQLRRRLPGRRAHFVPRARQSRRPAYRALGRFGPPPDFSSATAAMRLRTPKPLDRILHLIDEIFSDAHGRVFENKPPPLPPRITQC